MGTKKKKRKDGGPLTIEIDECAGRIVGKDSQNIISKAGCVVRQYGQFDGSGWKKQKQAVKEEIISNCTVRSWFLIGHKGIHCDDF